MSSGPHLAWLRDDTLEQDALSRSPDCPPTPIIDVVGEWPNVFQLRASGTSTHYFDLVEGSRWVLTETLDFTAQKTARLMSSTLVFGFSGDQLRAVEVFDEPQGEVRVHPLVIPAMSACPWIRIDGVSGAGVGAIAWGTDCQEQPSGWRCVSGRCDDVRPITAASPAQGSWLVAHPTPDEHDAINGERLPSSGPITSIATLEKRRYVVRGGQPATVWVDSGTGWEPRSLEPALGQPQVVQSTGEQIWLETDEALVSDQAPKHPLTWTTMECQQ